ncbi:MAG TPA: membrane dipeptidase [Ramlibacter sp.]|nr:membrane dipeptidase [Ramlibacter sp.]
MHLNRVTRRSFGLWTAAALLVPASDTAAQPALPKPYLADMHSHIGMFGRNAAVSSDLRRHMEETGTTLLAWAIVDDSPWTRVTPTGIVQVAAPAPGEVWGRFQRVVGDYDSQLRRWNLPKALTPADVDAALAGEPHVLMASESANFLEGQPERVAQAHAMGLRHLQVVHYIETPLGDLQTTAPRHNGMPALGRQVIEECRRLGILVDLAHCTPPFVEQAIAASDAPMVWSHSWISRRGGNWNDSAYVARSLSPELAKRFAARGGVIGLWVARVRRDSAYPIYSVGSYADEIMRMADLVGPQAVAFGTDMNGTGANPVMTQYGELREVVNNLVKRGVPEATLHDICIGNYARVLKKAMK